MLMTVHCPDIERQPLMYRPACSFTDLGEFEKAATYYDRYIAAMDGSA